MNPQGDPQYIAENLAFRSCCNLYLSLTLAPGSVPRNRNPTLGVTGEGVLGGAGEEPRLCPPGPVLCELPSPHPLGQAAWPQVQLCRLSRGARRLHSSGRTGWPPLPRWLRAGTRSIPSVAGALGQSPKGTSPPFLFSTWETAGRTLMSWLLAGPLPASAMSEAQTLQ